MSIIAADTLTITEGDTGTVEVTIAGETRRVNCFARMVVGQISINVGSAIGDSPIVGGAANSGAAFPIFIESHGGYEYAWFNIERHDRPWKIQDTAMRWA